MRSILVSNIKVIVFLLVLPIAFTLVACGDSGTNEGVKDSPDTITYTVDVAELDPNVYPEDYPLIGFSDFESAFENLKEANVKGELETYQDIVNIFDADGAYYENCDKDYEGTMYKYYGWYADNGVSILITFKAKGDKLEYFAYTTNGII